MAHDPIDTLGKATRHLMIHKPMKVEGKITWYTERFRG